MPKSKSNLDFALALLESRPEVAATVLEAHDSLEVAKLLSEIPYRLAGPVLEKMLPYYAARVFTHLDPNICAGFMSQMKISQSTAILRYAGKNTAKKILSALPEKISLTCKLLLKYPDNAVGAWTETKAPILPIDINIKEALTRIASRDAVLDVIFIVDRERNLKGFINTRELFSSHKETALASLTDSEVHPVYAGSTLTSIKKHPGWKFADVLPVLDRHNHLIGYLRHLDFRQGVEKMTTAIKPPNASDPISNICSVYGGSLLALVNSVGDIVNSKHFGES